jgi:hypothetical protein
MTRLILGLVLALVAAPAAGKTGQTILLVARDTENHRVPGVRFTYKEVKSALSNRKGEAELSLPLGDEPGQQIRLSLVPRSKKTDDWFLVDPAVNVPNGSSPAEVVLMRRSAFRRLHQEVRSTNAILGLSQQSPEAQRTALLLIAGRYGLKPDQVETAIHSFAETDDDQDQGRAAYLEGRFSKAATLFQKVVERREGRYRESLGSYVESLEDLAGC